ncbi:MAG: sigma 54-interacting transcriptional regulator [Chromatiales bacterium]|nr:sigma 54-interacting transcriptional regulator [Gammaproteobacteria bacterium]MCP5351621.1 sigma 54-interacting transcriptional regulator [Chromatiales bacterium]
MPERRILLVDDDADLLALWTAWLEGDGYVVDQATNGDDALTHLAMRAPTLLITDLAMPGMDGMALLDRLYAKDPTLPVIMVSGRAHIEDALAATERGVASFLTKPVQQDALLENVRNVLRFGREGVSTPVDEFAQGVIYRSPVMERVLQQVRRVAPGISTVMIFGETGSGKELLARALHRASARADGPFVAVNCAALPEQLLESELFGHVKGAFTGALTTNEGLFRAADGGTLFLDEIGDMPPALQVRLLRVLQDSRVRPVGSTKEIPIDVRVVTATHRDLDSMVESGEFREDLYYRLNVIPLHLPALRERPEDIVALADHFLAEVAARTSEKKPRLSQEAIEHMLLAPWPGNVRQLANVMERCAVLRSGPVIPASLIDQALRSDTSQMPTLEDAVRDFEKGYLLRLLRMTQGNITSAARIAGRNRTDFYNLLNRHQLEAAQFRNGEVD